MSYGTTQFCGPVGSAGLSLLSGANLAAFRSLIQTAQPTYISEAITTESALECLQGLASIDDSRFWQVSPAFRRFVRGNYIDVRRLDIRADMRAAFGMPNVTRLANEAEARHSQEELIASIASVASGHFGIRMLLAVMREQLGSHNFHSLRAGIAYADLRRTFDPENTLPSNTLLLGGIMHDVGKLVVPEEILFKGGKLTFGEREAMQRHNVATRRVLLALKGDFPHMDEIALCHHPYPRTDVDRRKVQRRRLNLWTRIERRLGFDRRISERRVPKIPVQRAGYLLRLADTYDALASAREYKPPFSAAAVKKIMLETFPAFADQTSFLLERYPCPVN